MTSIPKSMSGVSISKNGGVEVLDYKTDLLVPVPKAGEVLIKNAFIGINYIDTYHRSGLYQVSFPFTVGKECSGHIAALGSGSHPPSNKVGAAVVALCSGAYAEYSIAETDKVYALPENFPSLEVGAAAILQGLTAITLIRDAHHVQKGDWVLVTAAAGGMGLWLCQLLKAIGAHVIGTASTSEKRALAEKNGAEVTLPYAKEMGNDAFVARVKELTGGVGVPVVFDGVGKDTFDSCLDCVARKGSMISYGNASGSVAPFAIARLAAKNVRLMRTTLFNFIVTREEFEKPCNELMKMVQDGKIDVKIHEIYPLKDAARAHTDIESRKTTGKLLLKP